MICRKYSKAAEPGKFDENCLSLVTELFKQVTGSEKKIKATGLRKVAATLEMNRWTCLYPP